jgi:hypothetical protein
VIHASWLLRHEIFLTPKSALISLQMDQAIRHRDRPKKNSWYLFENKYFTKFTNFSQHLHLKKAN